MRCPECDGAGTVPVVVILRGGRLFVVKERGGAAAASVPCAGCGGSGIAHCCEAERASPEPEVAEPSC